MSGAWIRTLWILLGGVQAVRLVAAEPISFSRQVAPILERSCVACHQPSKLKGGLDVSSFKAITAGGKHGPVLTARAPATSRLVSQVKGPKPEMPPEGAPLSAAEVRVLEQWIEEGAVDDTPVAGAQELTPIRYQGRPILTALAWSPDGRWIAVPGQGEVLVFSVEGLELKRRLRGTATRIESLAFSPDGSRLAAAGGTPSRFGELQIWDPVSGKRLQSARVGTDSVFGASWSPDGTRVALGGADRTVRVVEASTGREQLRFEQHTDWVFGACFSRDGSRVISASRDRSMKLIDAATGALIDEICRPNEPLLGLMRHPQDDVVAALGGEYRIRVFKVAVRPDAQDVNADPNFVREYDGFEGGMTAAAYSPDGKWIATSGAAVGEVRVHDAAGGGRKATLTGHGGLVFGLAFSPDGRDLATAGAEGLLRIFRWSRESLSAVLDPVAGCRIH
jgi:WD40 repeat protein